MRRLPLAAAALLFLAALALAAAVQVQFPLSLGDYAGNWGLKARTIFETGEITRVFAIDPAGEFSHPEYPPAWPLLLAGVSSMAGRYDEYLLAFLRPVLMLAVAVLAAGRTEAPAAFRLVAAATVCLLPYFQDPIFAGYAEALLLVFLLGGIALLEEPTGSTLRCVAGAASLALASMTKNEGLLAALVVSGAFFFSGRKREAALSAGLPLAATGAWSLFRSGYLEAGPLVDFSAGAFSVSKLLLAGREILGGQMLPEWAWLAGGAAVLALSPGTVARRRVPLLAAGVYTLLLFGTYAFRPSDPAYHVQNSWNRIVLLPTVVVVLPVLVESLWAALEPFLRVAPEKRPKDRAPDSGAIGFRA